MEFTVQAFTARIRELMYDKFPYMLDSVNEKKHPNRTGHIRDVAFKNNPTIIADKEAMFDIGNAYAEERYPYYHILENTPYIHKRNTATKKSKGSQDKQDYLSKRDYEKVSWNGKTFSKEYSRNVRGSRNRNEKVSHWKESQSGVKTWENKSATQYLNVHYNYIEKMLNEEGGILDQVAREFNLKRARTQSTGYADEYQDQEHHTTDTTMLNALMSHFKGE